MNYPPRFFWFAILVTLFLATSNLLASSEDSNPTGVSGVFNGNIATADGSSTYDPLTENYRRGPIDDVVVPGTVGAYPLKFSRTYNSNDLTGIGQGSMPPGALGNSTGRNWRHSYSTTVGNWAGGTSVNWKDASGY